MGNESKYLKLREENKYYQKFNKQKQKIRDKYPKELFEIPSAYKRRDDYPLEQQRMFRMYLKEVGDLMHQKEGWYQKFIWDTISDSDKVEIERKIRVMSKEKIHYY